MPALSALSASIPVALGGALGATLRYQLGRVLASWVGTPALDRFPAATLAANTLGSFAMGVLTGWLAMRGSGGEATRLFLGVGLLGGFTTFSAFSLEMVVLIERGTPGLAALYAGSSLALGMVGLFAGLLLARGLA